MCTFFFSALFGLTVACKGEDGGAAELAAVAGDEEGTHLRPGAGGRP